MDKTLIAQKIQGLREKYLDSDSISWIDETEKAFHDLVQDKELAENPLFKKLVAHLAGRIKEINTLLLNDKQMTDVERARLFNLRDVFETVAKLLDADVYNQALETMADILDNKLT